MESPRKVKVKILLKEVSDRQDREIANSNGDAYLMLQQIRRLLDAVSLKRDDEDKEVVLDLLNSAKLSNEIMADAFLRIDRVDLFEEKYNTIQCINEIINKINKL